MSGDDVGFGAAEDVCQTSAHRWHVSLVRSCGRHNLGSDCLPFFIRPWQRLGGRVEWGVGGGAGRGMSGGAGGREERHEWELVGFESAINRTR